MCPCRFVLGEPDAGTARVGALRERPRDCVDFPLDSGSPNYPRCTLYSPLLPHYCRKMYEKRHDTSFLFPEWPRAARNVIMSYPTPSVRYRTFDPAAKARNSPGRSWAATRTVTIWISAAARTTTATNWGSPRTRRTTLAARSPPAAPTPTPATPPSAPSPASPRVATISAAGGTGTSEVDLGIRNRPVPSQSGPDPRRARALPRAMTMPPSWITCLEMQGSMRTISSYCDPCNNKILFKIFLKY